MCPACIITVGGGLLLAKKIGINDILAIGLLTIFLSLISDIILRKLNHGKVFFSYQRIVVSVSILLMLLVRFYTIN